MWGGRVSRGKAGATGAVVTFLCVAGLLGPVGMLGLSGTAAAAGASRSVPSSANQKPLIAGLVDKGSEAPYHRSAPFAVTSTTELDGDTGAFAGIVVNVTWAQVEPTEGRSTSPPSKPHWPRSAGTTPPTRKTGWPSNSGSGRASPHPAGPRPSAEHRSPCPGPRRPSPVARSVGTGPPPTGRNGPGSRGPWPTAMTTIPWSTKSPSPRVPPPRPSPS